MYSFISIACVDIQNRIKIHLCLRIHCENLAIIHIFNVFKCYMLHRIIHKAILLHVQLKYVLMYLKEEFVTFL